MTALDTRLETVVGRTATMLQKSFDMHTVGDLLRHYPRRMDERGKLTDLAALRPDDQVTVLAEVRSVVTGNRFARGRGGKAVDRLVVVVGDGRRTLKLTFFNAAWRARELAVGTSALFAGKVSLFRNELQLVNPQYQLLEGTGVDELDEFAGALIPIYAATAQVSSWTIARCVAMALHSLDDIDDPLPAQLLTRHRLGSLRHALHAVHRPDDRAQWQEAKRRLKWDEALSVQLTLARRRYRSQLNPATARPLRDDGLLARFDARLPFTLTAGQRAVGEQIATELSTAVPMHRLLQGEVGSGKTIVALRAMLQVVDAGGQAALLAPTEVLATQHARSVEAMLGDLAQGGRLGGAEHATRVALLLGSQSTPVRRQALLDIASGTAGIVVGTHALIQENVDFAELGLAVVDEQHRFGVEQRDALRNKSARPPHLLVMTATPIPRTVAMTVFGDLETSVLSELPAGRSPIVTTVVPVAEKPAWLQRVWTRIREEVAAGHQAYVVCPRIGGEVLGSDGDDSGDYCEEQDKDFESESADRGQRRAPLAAVEVMAQLATGELAGLRLGLLHGQLSGEEKDRVMSAFTGGQIDVLIATTVVEVGVDVPNATVMVVLDADRFGISQLHQLRGRIGRGSAAGVCLLVTESAADSASRQRLDAVASTSDGFALARQDLQQRREGDVLGSAQSGRRSQLQLLSLIEDEQIISQARDEAMSIIAADPELESHAALADWLAGLVDDSQADYLQKA